MSHAVILAAGDYPTSQKALAVLESAEYLCCCDDAGKEYIERSGRVPDAIVGDGDSLPQEFKDRYASIYHQVDEQDFNDLTKATRWCVALGYKEITYLGVTGKREDHTIANLGYVVYCKHSLGVEPTIVTDYGTFTIHRGDSRLKTFARQQVSVFNLSCSRLSSKNLKWDIYPFTEIWQGALNEAVGEEIEISGDGEYVVFRVES